MVIKNRVGQNPRYALIAEVSGDAERTMEFGKEK